jgi:hypothetical protein
MKGRRKGAGSPPKSKDGAATDRLNIRVTPAAKARWKAAAKKDGVEFSEWVIWELNNGAKWTEAGWEAENKKAK